MPPGRRQAPSRRTPRQTATSNTQDLEESIASQDGLHETSTASEPAPPSEQLQSQGSVQAAMPSPLASDPQPKADSSPRPMAPRLASLKSRRPPTLSEVSAASEPPKPQLKYLPKSAMRRSKEARDAAEKAEAERKQSRLRVEAPSGVAVGNREGLQSRGGQSIGRGTGRPGISRFTGGQASGHLGGSTTGEEGGRKQKVTRAGARTGALEGSRSTARTKKDPIPKVEKGSAQNQTVVKEEALGPALPKDLASTLNIST